MQKFVIRFSLAVAFFVVILAVVGLFLPTAYTVERSISINAPTTDIHPWIENLERWEDWGPWKEGDPTIQVQRGDIVQGV